MALRSVAAAACLALLGGCREREAAPAVADAGAAAPTRAGVKVPLPEGWAARVNPDQSLSIGPAGRSVLRIDLRPGASEEVPAPGELRATFAAQMKPATVELVHQVHREGLSLAVVAISARGTRDAGPAPRELALLGVKRIGRDLFLCSTQPGASDAEVSAAAAACEQLSWASQP